MSFIYLASPYTDPDPAVRQTRFELAERFTANALRAGVSIFSPIVHNHELAVKYDLPKDFQFWEKHNYAMLATASTLWVLHLPGVETSKGVAAEIAMAGRLSIACYDIDPKETRFL